MTRKTLLIPPILFASALMCLAQQPDNTKINKRDQDPSATTADQQKMNSSDRKLTANIRHAIVSDKGLSTYAHNIKIISQNGMVTLKGPVNSEEEKKSVLDKAISVTGDSSKVTDQISVKQ